MLGRGSCIEISVAPSVTCLRELAIVPQVRIGSPRGPRLQHTRDLLSSIVSKIEVHYTHQDTAGGRKTSEFSHGLIHLRPDVGGGRAAQPDSGNSTHLNNKGPNFDTRFLTQPKPCQKLHTFVGNRADSVISVETPVGMPHHSNDFRTLFASCRVTCCPKPSCRTPAATGEAKIGNRRRT